jgi:DNA-binding NtrC family response regulator
LVHTAAENGQLMEYRQEKVLLVDDDDIVLYSYQKLLEDECAIYTAHGDNPALRMLAADGPFAVIISDFQMPGTDGLQLLARVRALYRDTIRVMMTSVSELQVAVDAAKMRGFKTICKFRLARAQRVVRILKIARTAAFHRHSLDHGSREGFTQRPFRFEVPVAKYEEWDFHTK